MNHVDFNETKKLTPMSITGAISGGFDPIHVGHVRLIRAAAGMVDNLIVFLNSDEWLLRKKGFVFMPWADRREILLAIHGVRAVYPVSDGDDTVCETLKQRMPHVFINSGDRTPDNCPENKTCIDLGIRTVWVSSGDAIHVHSSDLIRAACATYLAEKNHG